MLSRGTSTAGELSDIANVPRSRAYDIAESLEKKGFIVMTLGKPIKYMAIPPKELVERSQRNVTLNAERKIEKLSKLHDSGLIKSLESLYSSGIDYVDHTDLSGAVRGRDNIHHHLSSMISNATSSVVIATSGKGVVRKYDSLKRNLKNAKERGIAIKFLSADAIEQQKIEEIGKVAQVKVSKDMDARFCIIDGKDVLFMLKKDNEVEESYDSGVWVTSELLASTLNKAFEKAWNE